MTVLRAPDLARNLVGNKLAAMDRDDEIAAVLAEVTAASAAVRTAQHKLHQAIYRRRLAIRAARAHGCALMAIGAAAKASHTHIRRELEAPLVTNKESSP